MMSNTRSMILTKMRSSHTLLLLAFCLPVLLAVHEPNQWALWQFRGMIVCVNPSSWPVLDYADYGCYCGKGGSGTPVDDLDRCCQIHDQCYSDSMQNEDCWGIFDNPYTEIYSYKCDRASKTVTCKENNNPCEMFICECDRKAAMCFDKAEYNPEHEHLPGVQC